ATGWHVGWLIGPEYIIRPTLAASMRIVFCSNSPLQEAAAAGLEQVQECKFFQTQTAEYAERRKVLTDCFDTLGLPYTNPEGSYFILLDISRVEFPDDYTMPSLRVCLEEVKTSTCWFIALEVGVSSIP
ncbi:hypothetical protein C8R41DRAFT_726648, partial [Lentinula lateritia]